MDRPVWSSVTLLAYHRLRSAVLDLGRMRAPLPPDDLAACARVLDALASDPTLLAGLDAEARRTILTAAGRISRLDPTSRSRLRKAMRRKDRRARREHDARMLSGTEMRNVRDRP